MAEPEEKSGEILQGPGRSKISNLRFEFEADEG